jgi:hypothetical protein
MPYAIRFFAEGLLTSLTMLSERGELKISFNENDGEKAHVQEILRKCLKLYDEILRA